MYKVQSLWKCKALPVENVQRIHAVSLRATTIKQELQTLFSSVFFSKLSLREVMGGGREVERLFSVLVLAASFNFAFNLFVSLWCRYIGSSTKQHQEKLFASCLLHLLSVWTRCAYQCWVQGVGALLFQQSTFKQEVNGFLTFLRSEMENANSSGIYLNCGSTVLQPKRLCPFRY